MLKEKYVFNSPLSKELLVYADELDFDKEENITKDLRNRIDKYLEDISHSVDRKNDIGFSKLTYEKDSSFGLWLFYRNIPIRMEIVFSISDPDFKRACMDTLYNLITAVERYYGFSKEYNSNAVYFYKQQKIIDLLYEIADLIKDGKIKRIKTKLIPRILPPTFQDTKKFLFIPDIKFDDTECDLYIIKTDYQNVSLAYDHGLIYENLNYHLPEFLKDIRPDDDPEDGTFTSLGNPTEIIDFCFINKETKKRHYVQLLDFIIDDAEHYLNYILNKIDYNHL